MLPQDGSRAPGTCLHLKTALHGPSLALPRCDAQDVLRLQNLLHRHRDSLCRHLLEIIEPTLSYLLLAARFSKAHDDIGLIGFKICRRLIEGQVSILADAGEGQIDCAS